eukprot:365948-Chlamydomonas_euryale.AAC.11
MSRRPQASVSCQSPHKAVSPAPSGGVLAVSRHPPRGGLPAGRPPRAVGCSGQWADLRGPLMRRDAKAGRRWPTQCTPADALVDVQGSAALLALSSVS